MQESIFTKIIRGDIPSYKIYEDDLTIAFLDIDPKVVGHTLVVPRVQVDQFNDLEDEQYHALWSTVKKVANNHRDKLGVDRIGISVKGVDVPHAHVHVMPFNVGNHASTVVEGQHPSESQFIALADKLRFK